MGSNLLNSNLICCTTHNFCFFKRKFENSMFQAAGIYLQKFAAKINNQSLGEC
jgi:hypothetical protein